MDTAGVSLQTPTIASPTQSKKDASHIKIKARDMADLKAKQSIFDDNFKPPTGRKQHSRTAVLLLYWEKNDIHVAPEVEDLGTVLKERYHFEVKTFQILSKEHPAPGLQLQSELSQFICNHASPETLYIVYYAGHGWIKNGDDDDEEFKLGAQTTSEALENRQLNELVWMNAEKVLHKLSADVLLVFDCCYAGYLHKCYRGAHTFEFLGACNEEERTFGPGPKSFTKSLIWALKELSEDEQGFDTKTLMSKIKKYETFPKENLTPVLFHRDFRSTAHIWIEPGLLGEAETSRQLETEPPNEQNVSATANPEWLELSFVFNRPQEPEDIKKLAERLTELAADHTSHGLERIALAAKSPDPRLGWPYIAQWLDKVRRKSLLSPRPETPATAGVLIQESPPLEPPVEMSRPLSQDDTRMQAPVTPISGPDGSPSDYSSDPEPVRKRAHSHTHDVRTTVPEIRQPKRQRSKGK